MKKKVVAMSQGNKIGRVGETRDEMLAQFPANLHILSGRGTQPSRDRISASLSSPNDNNRGSNSPDITLQPSNFFSRVWDFFRRLTGSSDPSTGLKIENEGLHFLEDKDYNEGVKNTIPDINKGFTPQITNFFYTTPNGNPTRFFSEIFRPTIDHVDKTPSASERRERLHKMYAWTLEIIRGIRI